MAATVDIREKNGAGEDATVKTSGTVRFKSEDDSNVNLDHPIVRPLSGTVHSYEKWLRLHIGSTGPSGSITNPRAFSDGVNDMGTGVACNAGVDGSYTAPTSDESTVATSDFFGFDTGSPLALDQNNAGPFSGTNTDFGDYLVLQVAVSDTASPGLTPAETLTIAYDET